MHYSVASAARRAELFRIAFAIAVLAATAIPSLAQYANCGGTCHVVGGNVSDGAGGPFLSGHVYIANSSLAVPVGTTLTIHPGAIIKFDGVHSFSVHGTLLAGGTAVDPIIFTSLHDDTGGDHNGNGGSTVVAPGHWVQVHFSSTASASSSSYVHLRGAGWNGNSALRVSGNTASFTSCVVDSPSGACIDLSGNAAPTFVNCAFIGGTKAAIAVPLTSVPGFSGCTATGQTVRDAPEISPATITSGTTTITVDDTFNGSGALSVPATLTVQAGATLALDAGIVVKFDGVHSFSNLGTLLATGTSGSPVVLTSLHDDVFGGDTNRNGNATALAHGQWIYLTCGSLSDATNLQHLHIRGAGWNGNASLRLTGSDAVLDHVRVETSGGPCCDLSNDSYPTATNCAFDGGTKALVGVRLIALEGFTNCTAAGNSFRNVPEVSSAAVGAGELVDLSPVNTLNGDGVVAVTASLNIDVAGSLALDAGMKVKLDGVHTLNVSGVLTSTGSSGTPVVVTSIHDDVHGGDSNVNLGGTAAAPGQWIQISFGPDSDASNLQHLLVRAAGWNGNSAIKFNQSNATAVGMRTQLSGGPCLSLTNNCTPSLSGCAFDSGTQAAVEVPPAAVASFSGCTASGNTIFDAPVIGAATITAGQSFAWTTDNTFNGNGVLILPQTFTVNDGGSLALGAGMKIKFNGVHAMSVHGVLTTAGAADDPVVLTSLHDDVHGGDTNKNGVNTVAAPGHWVQAWFGPSSDASNLEHLLVRCAGWNGNPSIQLSQSNLAMTGVRVSLSGGSCLDCANNSLPTASFCAFDDGTIAVNNVTLGALAGFTRCTATGNSTVRAQRVTAASVAVGQTAVVRAINTLNGTGAVHVTSTITVDGTLDLGPGVVVKFDGVHSCNVNGTALFRGTGLEPVVFTSAHDDAFGGDSNANGAGSAPANGQWIKMTLGAAAAGVVERVRVRHAGWGGNRAFDCQAPGVFVNAVRADRSGGPGLYVAAAAGTVLDHLVAWNCTGEGLRVVPARTVRHATVAHCTSHGFFDQSGAGAALNCISWANGGGAFQNFAVGAVTYSCATGPAGATNVASDPLFVDGPNGDLRLQVTSPCLDVADVATSFGMTVDHVEGSRLSDGRLIGVPFSDMGAYELAAYSLKFSGRPWSFETLTLQVDGSEPGMAAYAFGLGGPPEAFVPWGFLLAGPVPSLTVLAILPAGVPFSTVIPDVSAFAGSPFVIQALGVPFSNSALGAFTNIYRGVIDG